MTSPHPDHLYAMCEELDDISDMLHDDLADRLMRAKDIIDGVAAEIEAQLLRDKWDV